MKPIGWAENIRLTPPLFILCAPEPIPLAAVETAWDREGKGRRIGFPVRIAKPIVDYANKIFVRRKSTPKTGGNTSTVRGV
jgi:hypothetical protein